MARGRMTAFATLGAVSLVGSLCLSFYMSSRAYTSNGPELMLPKDAATEGVSQTVSAPPPAVFAMSDVIVTPQNVQKVIATLVRPDSYLVSADNTLYWQSGSAALKSRLYVRDSAWKTELFSESGMLLHTTVLTDKDFFSWKPGDASYYRGAPGVFRADATAMLPTYEDALKLDAQAITEAGFQNIQYEPCIYLTAKEETTGLTYKYFISAVSGLLMRAEYWDGKRLVREVAISGITLQEPGAEHFLLPGGASVFDIE